MTRRPHGALLLALLLTVVGVARCEDPYIYFTWNVTWGTISPMGTPQRVILINGQFPGPNINSTTNNNVIVNIFNFLDEPFLLAWNGIQQRKNSWQDNMPGTGCPIPVGKNHTYHFQVKDQIGSYFYSPSIGTQKAAGGFGGLRINSRLLIPVPFDPPADDFTVLINDWYTKGHDVLARILQKGRSINRPAGVLMNGRTGKDSSGKDDPPLFEMSPGKIYRYRICNAGIKTSLNFRFQGHKLTLVEMDGSHTVQNQYDSLDVHLGQCMSVLVTADQPPMDYYMVASTRFTKYLLSATGVVRYSGSKKSPSPDLPAAPVGWAWSLNQWRSFRWNLTASAARPNPQGSYHYGAINITRTVKLVAHSGKFEGKLLHAFNGVSHVEPDTPLKLLEYFQVKDGIKYDVMKDVPAQPNGGPITARVPNVIKFEFRTYIEIILENAEKSPNFFHVNGYSFFAVGMGGGHWSPDKRSTYNLLDAVSRHSIQVYPKSWAAIMTTFDNAGMWNLRSELLERRYLGQELYISVVSGARSLRDEYNMLPETLLCGKVVVKMPSVVRSEPEPAMIPVAVEPEESPRASKEDALIRKPAGFRARSGEDDMMHDLDEMIFGMKEGGSSNEDHDPRKKQKDDLLSL